MTSTTSMAFSNQCTQSQTGSCAGARDWAWDALLPSEPGESRPSALPARGTLLAERFLIERELGKGGMGVVFEARDQRMLGRHVAIKWFFARAGDRAGCEVPREAAAAFRGNRSPDLASLTSCCS